MLKMVFVDQQTLCHPTESKLELSAFDSCDVVAELDAKLHHHQRFMP